MQLLDPPVLTTEVETPAEAREALDAAETLGLESRDVKVRGSWEGRDGPVPFRGSAWEIETLGRTWFHLTDDNCDTFAAKPRRSRLNGFVDGTLELRFDKEASE